MKSTLHFIEDLETSDVLNFKSMKGKFNRSQALEVKRELRRLAHS